nr:hypothetical protein [Tanacetum cinerariifolium]
MRIFEHLRIRLGEMSIPCSPKYKIVRQTVLDHLLSYALTVTADIPAVYLQKFWKTVRKVPDTDDTIIFKLDSQEIVYTVDMFCNTLQQPVETLKNTFIIPVTIEVIESFMNMVSYQGVVDKKEVVEEENFESYDDQFAEAMIHDDVDDSEVRIEPGIFHMAQQIISAAQLVPKFQGIGRCNNYVVLQSIPCSLECKDVGQIVLDHPLSYAFTAIADIPAVYLQQFWKTVRKVPNTDDTIIFKLESQETVYTVNMFRTTLKLPVETPENPFVVPATIKVIESFMNRVGYQGVVDKPKNNVIQYPRFTKLIIADLIKKYPSFPQRIGEDYHSIKDDILLVSVYTTRNVTVQGMMILDAFLTEEIRATDDYKEYEKRKKRKQSTGETSCNTSPYAAHNIVCFDRKLTDFLCGPHVKTSRLCFVALMRRLPGRVRIELGSHKEHPEIVVDDDDNKEKKDEKEWCRFFVGVSGGGSGDGVRVVEKSWERGYGFGGIFLLCIEIIQRTMIKLIQNKAQTEQYPVEPSIKCNKKHELGEELLKELHCNSYSGRVEEDVIGHVAKILKVLDPIEVDGLDPFQLCMITFPLLLSGNARKWWMNEGDGKINTWEELVMGNNEGLIDEDISSDDDGNQTNLSMLTKPEIKISDEFLKFLHDYSFNGMDESDINKHIRKVLEITKWIKIPNVDMDELRLYVFSKSLSGDAKKWWDNEGATTT